MTITSLIGLGVAMLILAVSPGPGMLATMARSMATGFRSSLPVIMGIVMGDTVYLLVAVFGMASMAQLLGGYFIWVKIGGGIYLVCLGVQLWIKRPEDQPRPQSHNDVSLIGRVLSGLLITLSNPKVILFYCGFLPNFMDLARLNGTQIGLITGIIIFVVSTVLMVYAFVADKVRQMFHRRGTFKVLNRSAGTVMIAAGIGVAVKT